MVPDLVGKARTVDAMVLENVIQGITRVGGPLAAGYVTARLRQPGRPAGAGSHWAPWA